jgi:hypothetical protein
LRIFGGKDWWRKGIAPPISRPCASNCDIFWELNLVHDQSPLYKNSFFRKPAHPSFFIIGLFLF